MRRKLTLVLLVLAICSSLFAADWAFVFKDLGQHPEILGGFLPSYLMAGAGYKGASLIEGDKTQIDLIVGAGYNQRKVWQDPITGAIRKEDPVVYDVIVADWAVRFNQGFLDSPAGDKDLLTLSAGYWGKFEKNIDSMAVGKTRKNGVPGAIKTLDQYLAGVSDDGNILSDVHGSRMMLGNSFSLSLKLDAMSDTIMTNDGFWANLELRYAPKALNSVLDGFSDFYSITLNAVGACTLFDYATERNNWFSIVAIDRVNVNWTDGSAVPQYEQSSLSLGRKVRGFTKNTYNTQFTVVNNFDIRLAGIKLGLKGIHPRINLFFDMGYSGGKLFNTDLVQSDFLCSTGAQFTISAFDFIDLGYQLAYIISGESYQNASKLVGSFTFFLDF